MYKQFAFLKTKGLRLLIAQSAVLPSACPGITSEPSLQGLSSNEGLTLSRFSSGAWSWESPALLHKQWRSTPLSSDILSREAARQQITAHLHVSWSAMTRVGVTGIFGLKWFSRYPSHLSLSPSFSLCVSLKGIYKSVLLWKHTIAAYAGRINEFVSGYLRLISLIFKRSFDVWLENKSTLDGGTRKHPCYLSQVPESSTFSH